jgi:hypothetical protein
MNSSTVLKRRRIVNLIARFGLFALILILGTVVVPLMDGSEVGPDRSIRYVGPCDGHIRSRRRVIRWTDWRLATSRRQFVA